MSQNRSSNRSSNSDRVYLDVVAFIETGKEKKLKPRTVGYAWSSEHPDYGKQVHAQIQMMPTPGNGWDGTVVIQQRREREDDQQQPSGRQVPNQRRRE